MGDDSRARALPPGVEREIRVPLRHNLAFWAMVLLFVACGGGAAFFIASFGASAPRVGDGAQWREIHQTVRRIDAVAIAFNVVGVWASIVFAVRVARMRVWVTEAGVACFGVRRPRLLGWEDIQLFVAPTTGSMGPCAVMRDGRLESLFGTPMRRSPSKALVDELNGARALHEVI